MKEEDIFITKLHINDVRHLKDIEISISETERKHLILTGKNGSGKTSVLEGIDNYTKSIETNQFNALMQTWQQSIKSNQAAIVTHNNQLNETTNNNEKTRILMTIKNTETAIKNYERHINKYTSRVDIDFSTDINIQEKFNNGSFLITHFNAKRLNQSKKPKGINQFDFKKTYKTTERANENFIQHIVNLKADRSFARDDNEEQAVKEIDTWFNRFENALKQLFEDDKLRLIFDRKEYNFQIQSNGKEPFSFNELSDGYSAVLHIVTELIMRMESQKMKSYDIQGIVLIDEVETHLHIALQKKILPFLIEFFPKIQFIITTHSPFVLNSIENAVIYDLENKILVEDLSGYSYEGLVESFFLSDKYSDILKKKINRYEALLKKENPTEEDFDNLLELKLYLKKLPTFLAPELNTKLKQLERLNGITV